VAETEVKKDTLRTVRPKRHGNDLAIINRRARRLNEEAEDVLTYQVIP
jgi:hypothetical protein